MNKTIQGHTCRNTLRKRHLISFLGLYPLNSSLRISSLSFYQRLEIYSTENGSFNFLLLFHSLQFFRSFSLIAINAPHRWASRKQFCHSFVKYKQRMFPATPSWSLVTLKSTHDFLRRNHVSLAPLPFQLWTSYYYTRSYSKDNSRKPKATKETKLV